MYPHTDSNMGSQDTAFSIDSVQETLETEQKRERVEVAPGTYTVEIQMPLPEVRQDSKGHNKLLLPLEIIGGVYESSWLFEAIYMNNQHDEAGKVKDGIGKRKVARYAHALGLKTLSSLTELEGKYVKIDYGPNKNGFNEVREVSAFSADASPNILTPPPVKEKSGADIPF